MNMYFKPRDFEGFVGIPWLDGGRTRDGVDCWGLFWLVYKEVFGIELPSYSEDYTTALDRIIVRRLVDNKPDYWVRVLYPAVGDGAVMHIAGRPHIGVYIGDDLILHIEKNLGAKIENYRSMKMVNMLDGFYRYYPT